MLGTVKEYRNGKLVSVVAKNDCDFDYSAEYETDDKSDFWREGYASLGTVYKYNPVHCRERGTTVKITVYKNCNEDNPMFIVYIDGNGINGIEVEDLETD